MMAFTRLVHIDLPEPEEDREPTEVAEQEARAFFDRFKRQSRRYRRQLVRSGALLTPDAFCRRRGISRRELSRIELQRDVFSIDVGHRRYYPRELAKQPRVVLWRLTRVCRRFGRHVPDWAKHDVLTTRWAPLGDATMLRAIRRPRGLRWSFIMANGTSEEWAPR